MSKKYYIGYESLINDFKRYQASSPRGVGLVKEGKHIYLQFKTPGTTRSKYDCNCEFTTDGMSQALTKSQKVAEALKKFDLESEFWEWYDREIKEENSLIDDLKTFEEAIAVVEDDFWARPSRTGRRRSKDNQPADRSSWHRTYGCYYKLLPQDKHVTLKSIQAVIDRYKKGTKSYQGVVSAMKRLARMNGFRGILEELESIVTTQTEFLELQAISIEEFLEWRDSVLSVTGKRHHLEIRKAWLWVFSIQVVYGLRLHEVFAVANANQEFVTEDRVTIPALGDPLNEHNLLVIGKLTALGTTTKTGYRLARPMVPPSQPRLLEQLDIKKPLLPNNKPRSRSNDTIRKFYCNTATRQLKRWNALSLKPMLLDI